MYEVIVYIIFIVCIRIISVYAFLITKYPIIYNNLHVIILLIIFIVSTTKYKVF